MSDDDFDERHDHDADHPQRPKDHWIKRHKTLGDYLNNGASLVAIAAACGVVGAWMLDSVPVVKTKVFNDHVIAEDMRLIDHDRRISSTEISSKVIQISQMEVQELQLEDRIQMYDDRLKKMAPNSEDYDDFRRQMNEMRQRLETVKSELTALHNR